jgi:hypothetical protein
LLVREGNTNLRESRGFELQPAPLIAVRDVNEHGYDGDGSVRPSMHNHEGAILDETSLVIHGPEEILMGPLNLHAVYLATNRIRTLAGFSALYAKDGKVEFR